MKKNSTSSPSFSLTLHPAKPLSLTHSWTAPGTLFLSNMRLVFVASQPDQASGLVAFSLPLALLSDSTQFVQPIFRCNHLAGSVKAEGEGNESHSFKLEFREGGVGTFLPLFLRFLEYLRAVRRKAETGSAAWSPPVAPAPAPAAAASSSSSSSSGPPPPPPQPVWPAAAPPIEPDAALVDPSDPSKIYLTAPVAESAGTAPFGGAGWGGAPPAPEKK